MDSLRAELNKNVASGEKTYGEASERH